MAFSEQLKRTRQAQGLTQRQVAESMGVSKQTITAYEAGTREPDLERLVKLAEVLNTTPDTLLETEKAPAQIEQELSEKDRQIIYMLPYAPEGVKDGILTILDATVDLDAAAKSAEIHIERLYERRALADAAEKRDERSS